MGTYVIRIPDIGEGIAEVELVAWHVAAGDTVSEDQLVADVMTDKATVEIPCPVDGKVISLGGEVGQTLAVGAELLRLQVEGAGNLREGDDAAPSAAAAAPAQAASQTQSQAAPPPPAAAPDPEPAPKAEPAQQTASAEPHVPSSPTSATESERPPRQRVTPRRASERPLASPAVRRRALDLGIELRFVQGSGPAGRIMHEDLADFVARGGQLHAGGSGTGYEKRQGEQTIPVIGLRRMIARKMQHAKRQIPHFAYVEEVDVTELEKLRQTLNARHAGSRGKLTLLPFLVRAMVLALREFPQINARYDDEADVVTRFAAVHMGVATQTPNGLMVPVVQHAEALDLWSCAQGIAEVAAAARSGKASRDTLTGSTITITSLGPLGGIVSTPVINHPEVAIVGVNRMVERPMLQDGRVVPRLLMNLSSSFDHRVVDGMDAAQFIQSMRTRLETPALLFAE
ncbi:MAG: dihydrolipoamide acetyltransferase family protein [Ottowia sp.]|nr:2-oxo acid dehydrogenase subunit E2 [Ottowia sp.]